MSLSPHNAPPTADPARDRPLSLDEAYHRVCGSALTESAVGAVGLELENHVVDLTDVARPVGWERSEFVRSAVRDVLGDNAVSREPGGQFELSAPPRPTVVAAVTALRDDLHRIRAAMAEHGIGLAQVGTDPLRPPERMNPSDRYRAMAAHFAAFRMATPGAVTMNSTASIQVNLNAGPASRWTHRVAQAHRIGPTLVAVSACSPWLNGQATGWRSARQRAWLGLDQRRCGPVIGVLGTAAEPRPAWARYALAAPVMFVRTGENRREAVCTNVTFGQWASGDVRLDDRLPTAEDLDLHLTTLFPPVRLRGYLELRYLDATPPRWWPAVVAVATTLMDDPVAADLAAEATEPTRALWTEAARRGLDDARLAESARRCLRIAAGRVPAELAADVAELAELVESGCSPGDLLARRIGTVGPHAAFAELSRP